MDFDTYIKWRSRHNLKENLYLDNEYKPHTDNSTSKSIPSHNSKQIDKNICSKPNDDYKREISSQYVIESNFIINQSNRLN